MALANWMVPGHNPRVKEKFFSVQGHRMHALVAGDGPDLLLLHGLLGSAEAWYPVLGLLAQESRIHAIDALGIGCSDRVPGLDASLAAQADRVAECMDRAGLYGIDVLGTSHGGAVAMMLAARHPYLVRSLVLHAPANPYSNASDHLVAFYRSPLGRWFAHQVPNLPQKVQEIALGRMYGDARLLEQRVLDMYMNTLRVPGTVEYVMSMVRRWNEDMRALDAAIREIADFPVRFIWGTHDRAVPLSTGRKLKRKFSRATMTVLPGVGHLPYEEAPEAFAMAVNQFLSRQDRAEARKKPHLVRMV